MPSNKIFVIGGAGFIGSHICEHLLEKKFQIVCIDNFSTGKFANIQNFLTNPNFSFINCDATNLLYLSSIFKDHQPEIVINLSAIPSVPKSIECPYASLYYNILTALNTVECVRKYNTPFTIFTSSSSIYGDKTEPLRKENSLPSPISPYATSKLIGEKIYEIYGLVYETKFVILRFFNVFGERQGLSKYAAVIPKFITSLLNNRSPVIFGDGNQTRDFTYVKNVVYAIELLINRYYQGNANHLYGNIFNIATGKSTSVNTLFHQIKSIMLDHFKISEITSINPIYTEERKGNIKNSTADISKSQQFLGYSPIFSLEEGLKRTIAFYVEQFKKS